jgi:proteic killer suppression protein
LRIATSTAKVFAAGESDAAELADLRVPPGNRLESRKGRWRGHYSIRINDQWRIVFTWTAGNARDVAVVDHH